MSKLSLRSGFRAGLSSDSKTLARLPSRLRKGVVGNSQRRNAAPIIEGVDVRTQPRFHLLVARGFGPGVGTGAEGGDEQRGLPRHTGDAVVNGNRRAGPVDEGFLASLVLL